MSREDKIVVILEDDRETAAWLEKCVYEINLKKQILVTGNVLEAYKIIRREKVVLLIADLETEQGHHRENRVVRLILHLRKHAMFLFLPIIVLDSSNRYRLYAFRDWHCVGHYVKPVLREHFMELVKRMLTAVITDEWENTFLVRHDNVRYPVVVKELMYVKYFNRALHLYLNSGKEIIVNQKPLQMVLQEARAKCLIQCNRATLVNVNYVTRLSDKDRRIILKDGTKLPVGKTYVKHVCCALKLTNTEKVV